MENGGEYTVIVNNAAFLQNQEVNVGNEADDEPEPISIKEMLIRLDGVFPMDEAVIEGKCPPPRLERPWADMERGPKPCPRAPSSSPPRDLALVPGR